MKRYQAYIIYMMIVVLGALLASCSSDDTREWVSSERVLWGTEFDVTQSQQIAIRKSDSVVFSREERDGDYVYYRAH